MQTAGQDSHRRQRIGRQGEDLAVEMLTGLGWRIIDRNWRCPIGEVDVIAEDLDATVVFCEVKTRTGLGFGDPLESITWRKQRTLRQLAAHWVAGHARPSGAGRIRVDAIGIVLGGPEPLISHVRGI
ncbi:MAG TPA: YraN family protein [Candidatus Avipropionibacterium avicola]|uniref:UPF0102 protein IAA98_16185 n=1 Tax=Candidatus Avipropionibacterium avicola TaxID=2840701 RepID=A0A9D1KQ62_9ACTN|nr:YraN family protein [Candidatus Avipropionibacterium avicola]